MVVHARTGNADGGGGEGKGNGDDDDGYVFVGAGQRGGRLAGRHMHPGMMVQGAPQQQDGLVWSCLYCTVDNQANDQVCWVCSKSRTPAAAGGGAIPVHLGAPVARRGGARPVQLAAAPVVAQGHVAHRRPVPNDGAGGDGGEHKGDAGDVEEEGGALDPDVGQLGYEEQLRRVMARSVDGHAESQKRRDQREKLRQDGVPVAVHPDLVRSFNGVPGGDAAHGGVGGGEAQQGGIWACTHCTFHNPVGDSICGACSRSKQPI